MPKRKRDDGEQDVERIKDQAIRIKASRLKARFDQGVSQLTSALKLARGFDRQKMTRRIQQAESQTDKSKIDRLKAETEVLNNLNESKVAKKYLLKQCVRTKRIAEAEGFVALFGEKTKVEARLKKDGNVGVVEGNVLGRLMKSGPVSEVVPGVMKGLREVLGVDKEKDMHVNATANGTNGLESNETEPNTGDNGDDEEDFDGFSDPAEDQTHPTPEVSKEPPSTEDDGMDQNMIDELSEAYADRLAAGSDSDSEPASDGDYEVNGQNHDRLNDMEITTDEDDFDQDDQSLPSDIESDIDSQHATATPHVDSTDLPHKAATTSFLPSLMHGGYYSGSSDASDIGDLDQYDPDKSFASSVPQPRKNRRGQRERQKIAEKKFGHRAKHLLKANGAEGVHAARQGLINGGGGAQRDQGWDVRRGAVESTNGRDRRGTDINPDRERGEIKRVGKNSSTRTPNRYERRHGIPKRKGRDLGRGGFSARGASTSRGENVRPSRTGANSMPTTDKRISNTVKSQGNEKLHPSWEAARKKKMESANVGAASFVGKKITFD